MSVDIERIYKTLNTIKFQYTWVLLATFMLSYAINRWLLHATELGDEPGFSYLVVLMITEQDL